MGQHSQLIKLLYVGKYPIHFQQVSDGSSAL